MNNWVLELTFHFPHDRFALGWETIRANEVENWNTIKIYLLIFTLTLDFD